MESLTLSSVSAHWYKGEPVRGHDAERAISMRAAVGEWVAVVGANGVGKSTLLHAISGTVPFSQGIVRVAGVPLRPQDVISRYEVGLYLVSQSETLEANGLDYEDAVAMAIQRRPGLYNESALKQLREILTKLGIVNDNRLAHRMFEMVVAIISVPCVLLIDEVGAIVGSRDKRAEFYSDVRKLLPLTTVVLVEHDISNVLEAADKVLWLQDTEAPKEVSVNEDEDIAVLREAFQQGEEDSDAIGDRRERGSLVRMDQSPLDQVRIALQANERIGRQKGIEEKLFQRFPFLQSQGPAEVLSGGQRVALKWILGELTGLTKKSAYEIRHLHKEMRDSIDACEKDLRIT